MKDGNVFPAEVFKKAMSPILTEICHWARQQPAWEQETLRRILACEAFDDATYTTLAEMLIEGKSAKAVDLSVFEVPEVPTAAMRPVLVSVSGISNVNALAPGQSIAFGPALTSIFGGNGSGKSSYARIFGSVCFTRGDREILPDLFEPGADALPQCALITVQCGGAEQIIEHTFGQPLPELARFYVFDTTCVSAHLTKANTLSFSPAGLSALQDLVKHTDKVREIVAQQVNGAQQPHGFSVFFEAPTPIAAQIGNLSAKTDLVALQQLGRLTAEEEVRVAELEREIARLRLLDVRKTARVLQTQIALVRSLAQALSDIETGVAVDRLRELSDLVKERAARKENAARAGAEQFASDGMQTVGSAAWSEFIQAARNLAEGESRPDESYPVSGARCLLCQQELSPEAAQLLHRLWEFLKGEAKRLLVETESRITVRKSAFEALHCNICEPSSAVHALLEEKDPAMLSRVAAFLSVAECRRRAALAASDGANVALHELPAFPNSPADALEALAAVWAQRLADLEKSDPAQQIATLQNELAELDHRRLLVKHFSAITRHVEQLNWAEAVRKKIKSSKHITTKYNELFEERVTGRYRCKFEEFLQKLGRPLRARIGTRGQKGAAVKTLELTLPEGSRHAKLSPHQVFSEGEKRAVVLADFLTEVALDAQAAGILLDDPVTSLDAEWKETIACLLAEQARERQVVVFTHDLHFLYLLKNAAEKGNVPHQAHWIRRAADGRPGHISLDNSPASEKDYKSPQKATEYCNRAAKTGNAEEQASLLKQGFGALRTTYEVFVLLDLFGNVVGRFEERISIERLRDASLDAEIVEQVIEKVGSLSRFIEGHSHSDAFVAAAPLSVEMLRAEIEAFSQLKSRLKELKKQPKNSAKQS